MAPPPATLDHSLRIRSPSLYLLAILLLKGDKLTGRRFGLLFIYLSQKSFKSGPLDTTA